MTTYWFANLDTSMLTEQKPPYRVLLFATEAEALAAGNAEWTKAEDSVEAVPCVLDDGEKTVAGWDEGLIKAIVGVLGDDRYDNPRQVAVNILDSLEASGYRIDNDGQVDG